MPTTNQLLAYVIARKPLDVGIFHEIKLLLILYYFKKSKIKGLKKQPFARSLCKIIRLKGLLYQPLNEENNNREFKKGMVKT